MNKVLGPHPDRAVQLDPLRVGERGVQIYANVEPAL